MIDIFLIFIISINGNLRTYKEKLDSLKKELEKVRKEKIESEREKISIMGTIEKINEEEKLLREIISKVEKQVEFMEIEKKKKNEVIDKIKKYIEGSRSKMKRSIIFLYKRGKFSPLNLILYGFSPYTFYSYIKGIDIKLKEEKMVLNKGIEFLKELEEKVESLKVKEENLRILKNDLENRELELTSLKEEKEKLLEEIKKDERKREKLVSELKESIKKLNKIISEIEKKLKREIFGKEIAEIPKKDFAWPINGKVHNYFGTIWHPVYKTKIKNNGIDILSEIGKEVKASSSGIVEYAGDFLGYGKLVIIDHTDGFFTIYGNLDEIYVTVGKAVSKGEIIGRLGKDMLEDLPLLHFEIRYGGKPIDPLYFLKEIL
ncbi:MAG: peptidoglycan DD-metalloendopeptidase family protein [candidate division WOR-3 bacterium]